MRQYRVEYSPAAKKELAKTPNKVTERIVAAVRQLAENPRPRGCKKLEGETDMYRIRVGNYRVIYTVSDEAVTVLILRVGHRKDVYR